MKKTTFPLLKALLLATLLGLSYTSANAEESITGTITIVVDGVEHSQEVDFSDPVSVSNALDALTQSTGLDSSSVLSQMTQQAQAIDSNINITFITVDGNALPLVFDPSDAAQVDTVAKGLASLGVSPDQIKSDLVTAGVSTEQAASSAAAAQPGAPDVDTAAAETLTVATKTTTTVNTTSELQSSPDQGDPDSSSPN